MNSVVVFYCIVFLYSVRSMQADPMLCRENEILDCVQLCPPERTCRNRGIAFNCLASDSPCRPKCVCKDGYYRNSIGECTSEENCDKCSRQNEYFSCGPECDNVCSELHTQNQTNCPIVNIVCNKKCYCDPDHARNEHGNCIPIGECPNVAEREKRHPHHHHHVEKTDNEKDIVCGQNEEYTYCKKSCPPETCISIVARFKCDSQEKCKPGCVCKPMFLRKSNDAPCTPIEECPQLKGSLDFIKN
ncbi:inducible metalloproteinase inhibitor protein-like isoform X2 [Zerene cesonia]|uniref:inducible metalloproteinase inhibitor protein-like isoform X2 n=1 Tax=Zerene cesonia TaxID=33412 RepID=UPI0018E534DA|nr:inducible metalloproteinase inhibitor protein-like isoform X2 [Zerene cesonia]